MPYGILPVALIESNKLWVGRSGMSFYSINKISKNRNMYLSSFLLYSSIFNLSTCYWIIYDKMQYDIDVNLSYDMIIIKLVISNV